MINTNQAATELRIIYLSIVFGINIEPNMFEYECNRSISKNVLDPDKREYYLDHYTKMEAEGIVLNWKLGRV